jgi:hypothetical protein
MLRPVTDVPLDGPEFDRWLAGFTPEELVRALGSGNRLAVAVNAEGVILQGPDVFRALSDRA